MRCFILLLCLTSVFVFSWTSRRFVARTTHHCHNVILEMINDDSSDQQMKIPRLLGRINKQRLSTRKSISSEETREQKSTKKCWRVFNIEVLLADDPGKDDLRVHDALCRSVMKTLQIKEIQLSSCDIKIVRKSFDGRWKKLRQPKFVYTVDITSASLNLKETVGKIELVPSREERTPLINLALESSSPRPKIVIVGAGPAGLFAAIELAEAGIPATILERGYPVEQRGRDIGALFNRKILNPESNLCYGEGGAGTWSDGKLTTRIGKNSDDVRKVLHTLVDHGAPERILLDGKPHLGTDRLVRILRDLRSWLTSHGTELRFASKVDDISFAGQSLSGTQGTVNGVILSTGEKIDADIVILAVGHRILYERLETHQIAMQPKTIAVGFRVEHPQELINKIQYGDFGRLCDRGKGPVPVADYRLAVQVPDRFFPAISAPAKSGTHKEELRNPRDLQGRGTKDGAEGVGDAFAIHQNSEDVGAIEDSQSHGCYSFCMCPGGQIVPSSVNASELCVNGMSFSKRQSQWANAALVVSVNPTEMDSLLNPATARSSLKGVEWQRIIERRAAVYGGGSLVAPVQRVTDFLDGKPTPVDGGSFGPLSSSYRMGVKGAACHEIYPTFITEALRFAIAQFDKRMPGFITPEALLHGVETRTSAPVQILRHPDSLQCVSMGGLYPTGEGAGYAGGIMSAAVDGMKVGRKILEEIGRGSYLRID